MLQKSANELSAASTAERSTRTRTHALVTFNFANHKDYSCLPLWRLCVVPQEDRASEALPHKRLQAEDAHVGKKVVVMLVHVEQPVAVQRMVVHCARCLLWSCPARQQRFL